MELDPRSAPARRLRNRRAHRAGGSVRHAEHHRLPGLGVPTKGEQTGNGMRRLLLLIGLIALLAPAAPAAAARPPVKHVFVIVLENKDFDVTFGPGSQSPYLSKTLAN